MLSKLSLDSLTFVVSLCNVYRVKIDKPCQTNYLVPRIKLIHWGSMYSTLPTLPYMIHEVSWFIFRTYDKSSHPRVRDRTYTYANIPCFQDYLIPPLPETQGGSLHKDCCFPVISYKVDPSLILFHEVDPCSLCFVRHIRTPSTLRGRSSFFTTTKRAFTIYALGVGPHAGFSFPLKVLSPSSKCPHPSRSWIPPRGGCLPCSSSLLSWCLVMVSLSW